MYLPGTGGGSAEVASLVWIDRQGDLAPLAVESRAFDNPRLSPDGTRIAVEIEDGDGSDVWIYDVERGAAQRLTVEGDSNEDPVWSHDSEWVYLQSDRSGDLDIWRKRADRSGAAEPVLQADGIQWPHSISADGTTLFYCEFEGRPPDIGLLSLAAEAEPEMLIESEASTLDPWPSPDGRFVAFETDEGGSVEVVVVEIATRRLWPVSTNGGTNPRWSSDGSEIFYYQGRGRWYSVAVSTGPVFSAEAPRQILELPPGGMSRELEVSADAQRFLGVRSGDATELQQGDSAPSIHVVLNWFEDLKERVPTRR